MTSFNGCDQEIFDAKGYFAIKNSREIARDKKCVTYEADITGDIAYLEELITAETGKKTILVQRE